MRSRRKLIDDPELYNRLSTTARSMETITKKMEKGEGTLGKLSQDSELYEHLNHAAERLDQLTAKIESGEGLAGQPALTHPSAPSIYHRYS